MKLTGMQVSTENLLNVASPTERWGDVVRRLRKAVNMQQADLAKKTGISLATIHRLEYSKTAKPRLETVVDLLTAMGYRVSITITPPEREDDGKPE